MEVLRSLEASSAWSYLAPDSPTLTVRNFIHDFNYGHNYASAHSAILYVYTCNIQVYYANLEFKEGSRELGIEVLVVSCVCLHLLQAGKVEEMGRAMSLVVKLQGVSKLQLIVHGG